MRARAVVCPAEGAMSGWLSPRARAFLELLRRYDAADEAGRRELFCDLLEALAGMGVE